jgi:murein DD-endopeptidase MepM/ murein hydrolase activator NlpD
VTVRAGQSLGGIAHSHHVSERDIVAANHLKPPYKLAAGTRLLIPGSGASPPQTVTERAAIGAPAIAERPPAGRSPDIISLDGPTAPKLAAAPSPAMSPAAAAVAAEVARESERSAGTRKAPGEVKASFPPERAEERQRAEPPAAMHGGRFSWPVQGRLLAGYGTGAGGAHNDGINIAADRGTPIKAIEGGVVAYAGNELRGYGNLVLVKHPDGLISAYAHCDELLVKKGDKIGSGQVIGRVGASGGVAEPQLHFELRRGKQPVDPRQFLGPAPSAGRGAAAG